MKRFGLIVAMAAMLVMAPRLTIAYLAADSLALPVSWEYALLTLTAVATGVVLTGGGMYIMHVIGQGRKKGWRQAVLIVAWLLLLFFAAILVGPLLKAGLPQSGFGSEMSETWQWVWAIVAVLAVEVLAGASMLAREETSDNTASESPGLFAAVNKGLTKRAERWAAGANAPAASRTDAQHAEGDTDVSTEVSPDTSSNVQSEAVTIHSADVTDTSPDTVKDVQLSANGHVEFTPDERQRLLSEWLADADTDMTKTEMADRLGVSRATVYNDLAAIEEGVDNGKA